MSPFNFILGIEMELDWLQVLIKQTPYPYSVGFKLEGGDLVFHFRLHAKLQILKPYLSVKTAIQEAKNAFPLEIPENKANKIPLYSDNELLNYMDLVVRRSETGLSFDHIKYENSGFRLMRRFHIGEPQPSLRLAISRDMGIR